METTEAGRGPNEREAEKMNKSGYHSAEYAGSRRRGQSVTRRAGSPGSARSAPLADPPPPHAEALRDRSVTSGRRTRRLTVSRDPGATAGGAKDEAAAARRGAPFFVARARISPRPRSCTTARARCVSQGRWTAGQTLGGEGTVEGEEPWRRRNRGRGGTVEVGGTVEGRDRGRVSGSQAGSQTSGGLMSSVRTGSPEK